MDSGESPKKGVSRRAIIAGGAIAGVALATDAAPAEARTIPHEMPWEPGSSDAPHPVSSGDFQFFNKEEADFIKAAVDRLIPADDLGPGALAADVPLFLDRQLGGAYGRAERWYMTGPWRAGTETQGYQLRLSPAQLYRFAIASLNRQLGKQKSKTFDQLTSQEQDDVLHSLETGSMPLDNVSGKAFFELLLQNTVEGFFSDPIYGGNKDMVGWKLIGFPGARYDYRDYVGRHGEKFPLPPVSLQGRPDWNPQK